MTHPIPKPSNHTKEADMNTQEKLEWSDTLCDGKGASYSEAEKACAALGPEWRLPERPELESILDLTRFDPAADPDCFPDTESAPYWTRTTYTPDPSCAWVVNFDFGVVSAYYRGNRYACVRACRVVPAGQ